MKQQIGSPFNKDRIRAKQQFRGQLLLVLAAVIAVAMPAFAAPAERAIVLRQAQLYLSPDAQSQKLAELGRGREVAIIEKSNNWVHVVANTAGGIEGMDAEDAKTITGWMIDKGVVRTSTPNGDQILFGEGVDSEAQAERRGGRRDAAQDAMRLYARLAEYFPNSPRAGEAMYRAADIRWQLEKADLMSRPSYRRGADPNLRTKMTEDYMRQVEHKFSHTKWSDLAAWDMLDNKLCGEWQGASKCPDKEADAYENYAKDHPDSPKLAEALYEAAWRRAALVEIYKTENDQKKSAESRSRAQALTQRIVSQFGQTDWAPRAAALLYKLDQGIPTFGNAIE
jgi:hypothetical protein